MCACVCNACFPNIQYVESNATRENKMILYSVQSFHLGLNTCLGRFSQDLAQALSQCGKKKRERKKEILSL